MTVEYLAAHQLVDEIELLPSKSFLQHLKISLYSFTEGAMTYSMRTHAWLICLLTKWYNSSLL